MNTGQIHLPRIPSIHGKVVSAKTLRIEFPDYSREAATWFPSEFTVPVNEPAPTICLHFHQGIWCEALTTDPNTRVVTVDQLNTLMDRAAYAERFHNSDIAGSIADEILAIIREVKP